MTVIPVLSLGGRQPGLHSKTGLKTKHFRPAIPEQGVLEQFGLHSKFVATLYYTRHCLIKTRQNNNKKLLQSNRQGVLSQEYPKFLGLK